MKLRCMHDRRVMVLPSGTTIHRNDGTQCETRIFMGDQHVTKHFTINEMPGIPVGTCVLGVDGKPN